MRVAVQFCASLPAPGVRLSEEQQGAVIQFMEARRHDRDLDTVVGVLLGMAVMINERRGVSPTMTLGHVQGVCRRVHAEWRRG